MSRTVLWALGRASAAALLAVVAGGSSASAHAVATGGGTAYAEPEITGVRCAPSDASPSCIPGEDLRVSGESLEDTRAVVFLGRKGRADDRRVRPLKASPHRVLVQVPAEAASGRVRVIEPDVALTGPRVEVAAAVAGDVAKPKQVAATPAADGGVFPVAGRHEFGTAANGFGGGRGHQGHDVFAACGTTLVAALAGTVTLAKWQDRAGNYVVIKAADGTSQAYMHLLAPATVTAGQKIAAGRPIGKVGQTGRADGCHLHFELWTAPGWYEGGRPIDPLPALRRWDAAARR